MCWRLSESGLSAFLAAEVPENNVVALTMNFYKVFRVSTAMTSKIAENIKDAQLHRHDRSDRVRVNTMLGSNDLVPFKAPRHA